MILNINGRIHISNYDRIILNGISQGLTFPEISRKEGIPTDTLKHHAKDLYPKLGARNQAAAVCAAIELGVLKPRPLHEAVAFWKPILLPEPERPRS